MEGMKKTKQTMVNDYKLRVKCFIWSKEYFSAFKSSPVDSLVWRLATAAVYTMTHLNGIEGVAHLWHEIVLELRFRWENGYAIPG